MTDPTGTNQQAIPQLIRELDRRSSDGIEVTLLWNSRTNQVLVAIVDLRRGAAFQFDVAAKNAREAFHHPYAFAPDSQQAALAA